MWLPALVMTANSAITNYFGWHATCFPEWATGSQSFTTTVASTNNFNLPFGGSIVFGSTPSCVLSIGGIDYFNNDDTKMDFFLEKGACTTTSLDFDATVADGLEIRFVMVTWAATTHPKIYLGHHQVPTSHTFQTQSNDDDIITVNYVGFTVDTSKSPVFVHMLRGWKGVLESGAKSWKLGLKMLKNSGPGASSYVVKVEKDKDSMDFLLKRLDLTFVIAEKDNINIPTITYYFG